VAVARTPRARGGRIGAALAILLATTGDQAAAQIASFSVTTRATIVQALVVTPQRDLVFGNVVPGISKTIAVTDGGAGRLRVRGQASTPVLMSFTLPGNLTSGANSLPIDSWTGRWNTSAAPAGGTSFTPSGAATSATLSGGAGQLFVYLGARVVPATTQAAGLYTATVTLTVAYP
jgi:spore coat protein U-like protein